MSKKLPNVLTAEHPTRGTLWAAFDPSVHHIVGGVRETRFGARLSPFKCRKDAETALQAEVEGVLHGHG